jgi:aryl-alcohol dehydrogenase-like predicted oxidoreductase
MHATAEATARFTRRFPEFGRSGFYRKVFDLHVSSLGIGTYLGAADAATDQAYTEALLAAAAGGINVFDTAINYRNQRSERAVGAALQKVDREEILICTKAGYLTPGAVPGFLRQEDVAGGIHSMDPQFLAHQADRSRVNLGVETIDVFYLHNPETQLAHCSRAEFDARLQRAFARLEELCAERKIRWYGAATWDGFRKPGALSLPRLAQIAFGEGGAQHHFRFIQLPFNLGMVEAFAGGSESVLETASKLGIAVMASAALLQARILDQMPEGAARGLPGLASNAQRAIQFTRSTLGVAVALVGMRQRAHVEENLGVARVPPLARDPYLRLYPK